MDSGTPDSIPNPLHKYILVSIHKYILSFIVFGNKIVCVRFVVKREIDRRKEGRKGERKRE